jgi:hypothetical protein
MLPRPHAASTAMVCYGPGTPDAPLTPPRDGSMGRNIRTLFNLEPPASDARVHWACRRFGNAR